jgi:ABC-type dipeptide/oligopeptide/nickel transport system permease component
MAHKRIRIDDALEFAATPGGRSTVFWAAMAFAACHLVAWSTEPSAANLSGSLRQELIHFGAVLCRFVLPCAVMLAGLAAYIASKLRKSAADTRPRLC